MKKLLAASLILFCLTISLISQDSPKTKQGNQKPISTYQIGSAKVTVWSNIGPYGEWKNFEIEKLYLEGDKWLTTNSFDEKELLQLRAAIDKAISEELINVKQRSGE